MKYDYDISRQLQDDLIKAYNKVAHLCWSQAEAYQKTVIQPAPRFYVSPKQALQIISPMVKGDFSRVELMRPIKKRMYYALYDVVVKLSEKRQFVGKSLFYILQFAVLSPAPEFYISPVNFSLIRAGMIKGTISDDGRPMKTEAQKRSYEKLKKKRKELREYREKMKMLKMTPL
ncbi:MAG: hypothetical protein K6D91_06075 [Prevotella sp.]|nr:hypothetical protein [Prevotella sp.]